jgi:hypothetical protein
VILQVQICHLILMDFIDLFPILSKFRRILTMESDNQN